MALAPPSPSLAPVSRGPEADVERAVFGAGGAREDRPSPPSIQLSRYPLCSGMGHNVRPCFRGRAEKGNSSSPPVVLYLRAPRWDRLSG
eukprot:8234693-Pyramimonas_sp.AAC.1